MTAPAFLRPGFLTNMRESAVDELETSGTIPNWLHGTLIRNGPGWVEADKPMRHWFDGHSMLHRFTIENGTVSYTSKFLDCKAYRATAESGKFLYSDFATDPCWSIFGKMRTLFSTDPMITDSAKVNVGKMGEELYALGEPLMQVQIDPATLKSVGVFDYHQPVRSRMTTAHPQSDEKGSFNLVVQYGPINYYTICQTAPQVKEVASIAVREPAYLHSFGMTKRYFIIAEYPLVVNSILLALRGKPFIENFKWKAENGSRFLVIDRNTGKKIASIKTDAFFSFHHINAFEEGDLLTVDLDAYEDASIIYRYYKDQLADPELKLPFGRIERFTLDLGNRKLVSRKRISEACLELPVYDTTYAGRPDYRYVYGCGLQTSRPNGFYNRIVKVDLNTGADFGWSDDGFFPGEPVFVPRPGRTDEDEGVLLSVVLDVSTERSFLLVLNAADLTEIARAHLPHAILFGYHGCFLNAKN